MTSPTFSEAATADLLDRTEYESWLLETVYEIADARLIPGAGDGLVYPPDGRPPNQTIFGIGSATIGDWRPGFLQAGAPLVLVTGFKLLDMLLEWVLEQNGLKRTFRFAQKIAALKNPLVFPALIQTRPWLRDRLLALYEELEPLRGTIIHDRTFTSQNGAVTVSSSRGGTVGPTVNIGAPDLRNLALLMVSLLGALKGTWSIDSFLEKRLRRATDELAHLHRLPSLGQRPPGFLNVRVYVKAEEPVEVDVKKIREDLSVLRANQDVLFDLRIVAVDPSASTARAFLLPCHQLGSVDRVSSSLGNLTAHEVPVPSDVDIPAVGALLARLK